ANSIPRLRWVHGLLGAPAPRHPPRQDRPRRAVAGPRPGAGHPPAGAALDPGAGPRAAPL
ncbi:MAG: hypothetical protein AVDCRST_MAG68-957, partial [uncultured Gemmatimonadetes bacterium]